MHLPGPFRATVGLIACAAEEARHLPDRAIELPMLAVSTALQASLRAQQRYARLAARGDAVLNRRPASDEPPEWATFDEPIAMDDLRRATLQPPDDLGQSDAATQVLDGLFGVGDPTAGSQAVFDEDEPPAVTTVTKKTATKKTATKAPAKRAAAKKAAAKTAAKQSLNGAADDAPSAEAAITTSGKTVSKPRHTAPSRFDDAGDD